MVHLLIIKVNSKEIDGVPVTGTPVIYRELYTCNTHFCGVFTGGEGVIVTSISPDSILTFILNKNNNKHKFHNEGIQLTREFCHRGLTS